MLDFQLIEGISNHIYKVKNDPLKKSLQYSNKPMHLKRLRTCCLKNKIDLQFLPRNFTRHKENTTFLNWTTNKFFWRIEWVFPQADNLIQITERALDTKLLATVLEEVMYPCDALKDESDVEEVNSKLELNNKLKFYQAAQLSGSKVLLKIEKKPGPDDIYHELDISLTLRENFVKKTIIEFPRLHVVLKNHIDMYKIEESDDEENVSADESKQNVKRSQADKKSNKRQNSVGSNYFFTDSTESDEDSSSKNQKKLRKKKKV
ncbi:hypothetical protein M0802_003648 [Mischocyttarus mexicanus]|nr:hypothetical protein M0802_003648 [Mischocyttarus mexicanus]